jgi:TniB protein
MPSEPSVIRFYVAMLTALGVPLRPRQRLAELEQVALALLRATGVRMLVVEVYFLAVPDGDGGVLARGDLYLDAANAVAQIDDVMTDSAHRGRGYARLGYATVGRTHVSSVPGPDAVPTRAAVAAPYAGRSYPRWAPTAASWTLQGRDPPALQNRASIRIGFAGAVTSDAGPRLAVSRWRF